MESGLIKDVFKLVVGVDGSARQSTSLSVLRGEEELHCHHFGVAHLALRVFSMMHGLEHIVTQAIHDYNLNLHRAPSGFVVGLTSTTLFACPWILHLLLIYGSNLG